MYRVRTRPLRPAYSKYVYNVLSCYFDQDLLRHKLSKILENPDFRPALSHYYCFRLVQCIFTSC